MDGCADIEWWGASIRLLPDRALLLPRVRTLVVADVHLGKPASFRAAGVPVPEAVTGCDLDRLSRLIAETGCERLVVVGDLIHDRSGMAGRTADAVRAWRDDIDSVEVDLVTGNHDRRVETVEALGVNQVGERLAVDGLELVHDPEDANPGAPSVCGHLHPTVTLGEGGQVGRVRAACFWFRDRVGVLPAFGRFTGGQAIRLSGAAVFAAGDSVVIPVTDEASRMVRGRAAPA